MNPSDSSRTGTPRSAWHHSLYWRIALGFVGVLAAVLLSQGLLFVWLARSTAGIFPGTANGRLATLVASELSDTLEDTPAIALDQHIVAEYGRVAQTFVVALSDGRIFSNRRVGPPAVARAQAALERLLQGRPAQPGGRRGGPQGPRGLFAPIIVKGATVGVVAVPAGAAPLLNVARELGPTMAGSALLLLIVGAAGAALLIFRPVRQRLDALRAAAERLGAGDNSARAPDHGADEVAALARTFNRMAADLQVRADALTASDKARRQLLADVSHELMTPLTAMRGYVETLAMAELRLDASTRERYLRIVDDETRRLEHIIGDLLDLARLEGGGATLRVGPVSIESLFHRVETRHARELESRRIHFSCTVAQGAEHTRGDADRLEQVLQNLAANALRHLPDGGRLTLSATPTTTGIRLTVRDNGPGVAPEHLPLIFDRFYKADASRASRGSGLGLSIVKSIVDAHGGQIRARNEDGAVFEIDLPATNA